MWNRGGTCPPDVTDLGDEVWNSAGIKILGTPIGTSEFVRSITQQRLEDEGRLWKAIAWVPDLQCAWQILLQCAGPRCHHLLRTLPPSQATEYAQAHDDGMLQVMNVLMGGLHRHGAGKDDGTPTGDTPHAPRRTRVEKCVTNGACSVLVLVGKRIADDSPEAARSRRHHRGEFGRTAPGWWLHWRIARRDNSTRPARFHWPPNMDRSESRCASTSCKPHRARGYGHMAGSSTRLPFLNTTSGRP